MTIINEQIVNVHSFLLKRSMKAHFLYVCIVLNINSARFIQAVSEMEFLGFVKSTKQKTDHVARLTWGGC